MIAMPAEGRRRVVIDRIEPSVDDGRFAVKRIAGDVMPVGARVFADGHERVVVLLRHREPGADGWAERPMTPTTDDRWQAELTLERVGRHEYEVVGWVDRFQTWRRDLDIRDREGVVTAMDLRIGAVLVDAAARRAREEDPADAHELEGLAASLRSDDIEQGTKVGLGEELAALMDRHPDRHLETTMSQPLAVVVDPPRARFGAWYELFPRSTAGEPGRHGTFHDVIDRLDYVDSLGFDVLYLPPVHPIGTSYRKGPNDALEAAPDDPGVPWAIGSPDGGHKAVHLELGTLADFDALVGAARSRDIDIALDLAFQTSPDHPWVKEHPDWFRSRPDGSIQYAENPPKKYQDAYPLDFETADWQGLWQELQSVVRFWMDHGVRIFRVDNPHTKPFDFWEWLIGDIKASDPDVLFLAEAFTRPAVMYQLGKLGFSQSYTYFTWRNGKDELRDYFSELTRPPVSEFFRANLFVNTPDILHAYLQEGGRPAFEVRLVLAATLGASYGIYGPPFEQLDATPRRAGSEEYLDSEKYQLRHWDLDAEHSIAPLVSTVNRIRREHPALQRDEHLRFHDSPDDILAYSKREPGSGDVVLSVVNLDTGSQRSGPVSVPASELGLGDAGFHARDLLTGTQTEHRGDRFDVSLDPTVMPAAIYHLTSRSR